MKISDIFKEILLEQSELKELFGISFDARAWSSIIKSHLKLAKNYFKNKKPLPDLTIIGKNYPKEYKLFPVDEIKMLVRPEYGNGAGYDEQKSGYNDGIYQIYLAFGPDASDSAINHELRHAYEDFMRMSKNKPAMKNTKEGINLFSGDFEKFMLTPIDKNIPGYDPFNKLVRGLYLTSKIERSAFADTVYDNDSLPIIYLIQRAIKETDLSVLSRINPQDLEKNWRRFKSDFKIPIVDKFHDYESFIKWASDEIKYKGERSIKKLLKVKFHRQQNKRKGAV